MNVESHWLCSGYRRLSALMRPNRRGSPDFKAVGAVLLMVAAGQALAQSQTAPDQSIAPDCKCRSPDGQMQNLGTVQCVNIVGRNSLVRCEMSTNTPYWKKVEGVAGCPDA